MPSKKSNWHHHQKDENSISSTPSFRGQNHRDDQFESEDFAKVFNDLEEAIGITKEEMQQVETIFAMDGIYFELQCEELMSSSSPIMSKVDITLCNK